MVLFLSTDPDRQLGNHREDISMVDECSVFFRVLPWRTGG